MPRRGKRIGTGSKDPPAKRSKGKKAAEDPDDDDTSPDLPLIKVASPTKPKYCKRNFDSTYG